MYVFFFVSNGQRPSSPLFPFTAYLFGPGAQYGTLLSPKDLVVRVKGGESAGSGNVLALIRAINMKKRGSSSCDMIDSRCRLEWSMRLTNIAYHR